MGVKQFVAVALLVAAAHVAVAVEAVPVPAGVSQEAWDGLLKQYVNDRGLVAYADWKKSKTDLAALDAYLGQFAARPKTLALGNDRAASLINLYNATTVRWILTNYPTESIMALGDSFKVKRHEIGGTKVSLDDIEHGAVRPLLGYRGHAVLVCAARSCPPLQRFAYRPDQIDGQIDSAYRAWLAREDLNQFLPDKKKVAISSIFNWFKDDFEAPGGVKPVLAQYAPEKYRGFLSGGDYEVVFLPYTWGLNDQGTQGQGYSRTRLWWDQIISKLRFWN